VELQNVENENTKEQIIEGKMSKKTFKIQNIQGI
jgi:hypothetical protein